MKVVILAGGFGTRLAEQTETKPKPMVEVGGRPILWHIMKIYSHFGFDDFIICLGYKGYVIKEYFLNYNLHRSDVTIDLKSGKVDIHNTETEPWRVTLVDTGQDSLTGGRVKRIKEYIGDKPFLLTYGDGVGDININDLVEHHKKNKKIITITSVQPLGRFGALEIDAENNVTRFEEKPHGDGDWINGGFFVVDPRIFESINNDKDSLEKDILAKLANEGMVSAFKHAGFWQPMDMLRDKKYLEELWRKGKAPWKIWS